MEHRLLFLHASLIKEKRRLSGLGDFSFSVYLRRDELNLFYTCDTDNARYNYEINSAR